jgi:hypothetical protein
MGFGEQRELADLDHHGGRVGFIKLVQCLAHELDDPRAVSGLREHRLCEHADTAVRRIGPVVLGGCGRPG